MQHVCKLVGSHRFAMFSCYLHTNSDTQKEREKDVVQVLKETRTGLVLESRSRDAFQNVATVTIPHTISLITLVRDSQLIL